ncbi:MAG: phosphopantetheine-binding protein, partial [Thermodesulfovibrionales bacterium]
MPNQEKIIASDLRNFLKEKLPDYMIPFAFVVLNSLPLTPNGKVDRKALPKPDHSVQVPGPSFIAPRTPLEFQVVEAWERVLGIQPVGITDNFFDLGGHSLLAVRLMAEVNKVTGNKLPVMALFQSPTVGQLAERLTAEGWSGQFSSLVPIRPNGTKLPFFWVHGQESDALLPRYLDPE